MKHTRILTILLLLLLSLSLLSSCAEGAESVGEPEPMAPLAEKSEIPPIEEITGYGEAPEWTEATAELLTWETVDGGIAITGYTGDAVNLRIPASIDGQAVLAIAESAFAGKALTALSLPDSLVRIGKGILAGASDIAYLHVPFMGETPEALQFAGYLFGAEAHTDHALRIPSSLKTFSLGSALSEIPAYAFFDCNDLEAILLPEEITSVGKFAFYNCRRLCYVPMTSFTAIAEYAFHSCASLTIVELGESLTSIGIGAFEGCDAIRRMVLPFVGGGAEENTYLAYIFGAAVPEFSRGYYPDELSEVYLLDSCRDLATDAFYECLSLAKVSLSPNTESIGTRAFYGCLNLREISLPAATVSIGDNAFMNCYYLERITFAEDARLAEVGLNAFYFCRSLTELSLPESLKALPASCFACCDALVRVDLGGVLQVGKNAFRGCAALSEASVSENVTFDEGNDALRTLLS